MKSFVLTVLFQDTEDPVELRATYRSPHPRLDTACYYHGFELIPETSEDHRGMYPREVELMAKLLSVCRDETTKSTYPGIRYKKVQNGDGTVNVISSLTYPEEFK